jgi:hypothetical protein
MTHLAEGWLMAKIEMDGIRAVTSILGGPILDGVGEMLEEKMESITTTMTTRTGPLVRNRTIASHLFWNM